MDSTSGKKKLTLKLKLTDNAPGANADVAKDQAVSSRASVFIVPEQTLRSPFTTATLRQPRFNLDKLGQQVKSNITLSDTASKAPARAVKQVEYGKKKNARSFRSSTHDSTNYSNNLNISRGVIHNLTGELNVEQEQKWRKVKSAKKINPFDSKPSVVRSVSIYEGIDVQTLAAAMAVNLKDLARKLKQLGVSSKPTDKLELDTAELIVLECGHNPKKINIKNADDDPVVDYEGVLVSRPPVVTIVGHVDHGKTSLLDAIRKTKVVEGEAGGITQHIGAYQVTNTTGNLITFLDTPGHETFTSMRERGVKVTDIAILVIAADDGIKEQTIEAIKHIQAANSEMIVAITKIDKPTANPNKVQESLLQYNIVTEKFSGSVRAVEISVFENKGITDLLDAITIQAEIMELKTRSEGHAIGVVLEASMMKGMGHVANTLIQKGTIKLGDNFVVGNVSGKVRCLIDSQGLHVKSAGPSMPVSVIGLDNATNPSDKLVVVPNEQIARETAQTRLNKPKIVEKVRLTLAELYARPQEDSKKLTVLLKADTMGSLEALAQGVSNVMNTEVRIKIVDQSVGLITDNDISIAHASQAIIVGFNIKPTQAMVKLAAEKFVHILSDKIIYKILENLQNIIDKMMKPVIKEQSLGKAQIIRLFPFSKGTVAGCKVLDGKIALGSKLRLIRGEEVIEIGNVKSLQKAAESAKEALKGQECGIMTDNFHDYKLDDILENYIEIVQ